MLQCICVFKRYKCIHIYVYTHTGNVSGNFAGDEGADLRFGVLIISSVSKLSSRLCYKVLKFKHEQNLKYEQKIFLSVCLFLHG